MILVRGLLVMFEEGVGLQTFTVGRSSSLLLLFAGIIFQKKEIVTT